MHIHSSLFVFLSSLPFQPLLFVPHPFTLSSRNYFFLSFEDANPILLAGARQPNELSSTVACQRPD